jgi:hypothetical protein
MAYIKLFFTILHGGGQVEPSGNGVGDPVEFTILSDPGEEVETDTPVGLTIKADDGYVCSSVEITPTGTIANKTALASDDGGNPGSWEAYGDPLVIGSVDDTSGVPFWVKCKAGIGEAPINDTSVTLNVSGIAAAE